MAEILDSANKGLATNKELDEIQLAFLEEDNPVENLLKGIYRYRVIERMVYDCENKSGPYNNPID
jgi:hypothetical protein